jgi:hypothetical protein
MDPCLLTVLVLNARIAPVAQFVHPFRHVEGSHAHDAGTVRGPVPVGFVTLTVLFRDTSAASPPAPHGPRS